MRFVVRLPHHGELRWRTTPQTKRWYSPTDPDVPLVMVNQTVDGLPILCREHDVHEGDTLDLRIVMARAKISTDPAWDGRRRFGPEQLLTAVIVLPQSQ